MTIHTNSGLGIAMESAIASAKTITAATNANPGVFTSVEHGYLDGEIVLLEVLGMTEVNDRLFKVYAKATDTFQLEDIDGASGIDTTAYGVFTSGTAKMVTLGTTFSGVSEFSPSGGDPKFLDTTTVHDKIEKQIVVGATPMTYGLTLQWDPADAAQAAMIEAFRTSANRGFKITWPGGRFMLFYGSVGCSGMPGGSSQGVTTTPAAIAMSNAPTYGS